MDDLCNNTNLKSILVPKIREKGKSSARISLQDEFTVEPSQT